MRCPCWRWVKLMERTTERQLDYDDRARLLVRTLHAQAAINFISRGEAAGAPVANHAVHVHLASLGGLHFHRLKHPVVIADLWHARPPLVEAGNVWQRRLPAEETLGLGRRRGVQGGAAIVHHADASEAFLHVAPYVLSIWASPAGSDINTSVQALFTGACGQVVLEQRGQRKFARDQSCCCHCVRSSDLIFSAILPLARLHHGSYSATCSALSLRMFTRCLGSGLSQSQARNAMPFYCPDLLRLLEPGHSLYGRAQPGLSLLGGAVA